MIFFDEVPNEIAIFFIHFLLILFYYLFQLKNKPKPEKPQRQHNIKYTKHKNTNKNILKADDYIKQKLNNHWNQEQENNSLKYEVNQLRQENLSLGQLNNELINENNSYKEKQTEILKENRDLINKCNEMQSTIDNNNVLMGEIERLNREKENIQEKYNEIHKLYISLEEKYVDRSNENTTSLEVNE